MKKNLLKYLVSLIVLTAVSTLFAGAIIVEFSGQPGDNQVELTWIVKAQSNLKGYQIHRSMDGTVYEQIKFVDAQIGDGSQITYSYTDSKVFKSTGRTFYYQLKIVELDGSLIEYDKIVEISPKISSARETWGSLKAMFR